MDLNGERWRLQLLKRDQINNLKILQHEGKIPKEGSLKVKTFSKTLSKDLVILNDIENF